MCGARRRSLGPLSKCRGGRRGCHVPSPPQRRRQSAPGARRAGARPPGASRRARRVVKALRSQSGAPVHQASAPRLLRLLCEGSCPPACTTTEKVITGRAHLSRRFAMGTFFPRLRRTCRLASMGLVACSTACFCRPIDPMNQLHCNRLANRST